jgi:hypothetical protein
MNFSILYLGRRYVDIKMQLDGRCLKAPSNLSANSQSAFLIRLRSQDLDFLFCLIRCESKSDVLKAPIQEIVCLFVLLRVLRDGERVNCVSSF